jgi:hypothetical protein
MTVCLLLTLLPAFGITDLFTHPVTASANGSSLKTEAISTSSTSAPDRAVQARVIEAYGKLPMSFEANMGQTDARVKFLSRGSGYSLFLTSTEAVLSLQMSAAQETGTESSTTPSSGYRDVHAGLTERGRTRQDTLRMKLVGANPATRVSGLEELPGKSNYLSGNDSKQWRTNVAHYAKVRYEAVYRGVDMVYYGNQEQLEYDFIVAPGADPSAISLAFEGAQGVEIDAGGDLVLRTRGGEVRQRKPFIYQEGGGRKHQVAGRYVKKGKQQVGFEVGGYDPSQPLVIDPVLIYSTFLGGSSDDLIHAIAADGEGNAYVVGATYSPDFPTTPGVFQSVRAGNTDAFVVKLNPSGSVLLYSTYLGGALGGSYNSAVGVAVDSAGQAYVAGNTNAPNFPTTPGAFKPFGDSVQDAFVAKLSPSGSSLVYSTCLGGSGYDEAFGIAIDWAGRAHVAGSTKSSNFPATPGTFDTSYSASSGNPEDAFVTKFDTTGSAVHYSTYLGGSGRDIATGIALDGAGNAYLTGTTTSTNFPTTPGAFDRVLSNYDVFVTKFTAAGSAVYYSTYLGGSASDLGYSIAVDGSGYAYVTGYTTSTNFPVTPSAFDLGYSGGSFDAFVTKLSTAGTGIIYSTYLGGSGTELGFAITVDVTGQAYVAGYTSSPNFPTTAGALDTVYSGNGFNDVFITKVNSAGSWLTYSTYFGGDSHHDEARGIFLDAAGNVYVGGYTGSTDFPTTTGAFDTSYSGVAYEGFVLKLQFP